MVMTHHLQEANNRWVVDDYLVHFCDKSKQIRCEIEKIPLIFHRT